MKEKMGIYEINDKVKLRKDWLNKLNCEDQMMKIAWEKGGMIEKLNTFIGIEMTIIDKCYSHYDLDKGEGFNFREAWLEVVE